MAKSKKAKTQFIDTDPTIGAALRFDGVNAQDFMDRKLRDIEGLLAGAMAMAELQSSCTNREERPEPLAEAIGSVRGAAPRVMLESVLLAVGELHTVASELARRYQSKQKK